MNSKLFSYIVISLTFGCFLYFSFAGSNASAADCLDNGLCRIRCRDARNARLLWTGCMKETNYSESAACSLLLKTLLYADWACEACLETRALEAVDICGDGGTPDWETCSCVPNV